MPDVRSAMGSAGVVRSISTWATVAWEAALDTRWNGPDVWEHGDVTSTNLLVVDGRLAAVIDLSCCAVGDPACDLAITWTLFHGESRRTFRDGIGLDDGTWSRGRGWALLEGAKHARQTAGGRLSWRRAQVRAASRRPRRHRGAVLMEFNAAR